MHWMLADMPGILSWETLVENGDRREDKGSAAGLGYRNFVA